MLLPRQQRLIGRHSRHNRRLLNPFLMNSSASYLILCRAVELHLLSRRTQIRLRLLINNPVCTLPFSPIVPQWAIVARSMLALAPKSVSHDPPSPSWKSHLPEYLGHPATLLKCTRSWHLRLSIEVVLLLQRRLEEDLPCSWWYCIVHLPRHSHAGKSRQNVDRIDGTITLYVGR